MLGEIEIVPRLKEKYGEVTETWEAYLIISLIPSREAVEKQAFP